MTGTGARRWFTAVALAVALSPVNAQVLPAGPVGSVLANILAEGEHPDLTALRLQDQRTALEDLYAADGGEFLWSHEHVLTRSATDALSELRAAESAGLRAEDYDANRLTYLAIDLSTSREAGDEQWALFDVGLTAALMAYAHDLHFGRIDPKDAGLELNVERSRFEVGPFIKEISHSDDVGKLLRAIEPPFVHYGLLKKALLRYRELTLEPELTELPALPARSEEHTSELQSLRHLVCRLLLE